LVLCSSYFDFGCQSQALFQAKNASVARFADITTGKIIKGFFRFLNQMLGDKRRAFRRPLLAIF